MAIINLRGWLASLVVSFICMLSISKSWGESFYEVSLSTGERQLDIFRKAAPDDVDDAAYVGASISAYRKVNEMSAWGAVLEVMMPFGRDNEIGSGRIVGLRPVNYLLQWNSNFATELFMGAAQYDWIKHATGYYLGANARIHFGDKQRYGLGFEYKYFQDLAHDGGPGGDQIIDGPALGLQLHYRFGQ